MRGLLEYNNARKKPILYSALTYALMSLAYYSFVHLSSIMSIGVYLIDIKHVILWSILAFLAVMLLKLVVRSTLYIVLSVLCTGLFLFSISIGGVSTGSLLLSMVSLAILSVILSLASFIRREYSDELIDSWSIVRTVRSNILYNALSYELLGGAFGYALLYAVLSTPILVSHINMDNLYQFLLFLSGFVIAVILDTRLTLDSFDLGNVSASRGSNTYLILRGFLASLLSWLYILFILSRVLLVPCSIECGDHDACKHLRATSFKQALGRLVACLVYGKPVLVHPIAKGLVKTRRGKREWYWRVGDAHNLVVLDPGIERNPHIVIAGASGSGKTTLAAKIASLLLDSGKTDLVVVIDFHGEYAEVLRRIGCENGIRVLDLSRCMVNPLRLNGVSPRERAIHVAETLQRIFKLGSLQRAYLERIILEVYRLKNIHDEDPNTWLQQPPTIHDLYTYLSESISVSQSYQERQRLEILRHYIGMLSPIPGVEECDIDYRFARKNIIIMNLSNVPSEYLKLLFAETIVRDIVISRATSQGSYRESGMYILVDEAHRLLSRSITGENLLARLVAETRKHNIGFIIVTQNPKDIDPSIIANSAIKITFMLDEPSNIDYMAKILSGYVHENRVEAIKNIISRLPVGFAVIRSMDFYTNPVLVETVV